MKKLLVCLSVALWIVGISATATADEWSSFDWGDLRPLHITFDKIELFIHSGDQTFVCPAFEDPEDPSGNPMAWEGGLINPNYVLATGVSTQAVGWTDHFSGPQSEPFTMTFLAYFCIKSHRQCFNKFLNISHFYSV